MIKNYKIIISKKAMDDVYNIAIYIAINFGKERAFRFLNDIEKKIEALDWENNSFYNTGFCCEGYVIYKKVFKPSLIFYIVQENVQEIHILRVLRDSRNWKQELAKMYN